MRWSAAHIQTRLPLTDRLWVGFARRPSCQGAVSPVTADDNHGPEAPEHRLAVLSLAFLLDQATGGVGALKTRDALLILAINQANIGPLTREPVAREMYGALDAPAPDDQRRPVSVSAVAASLNQPFETIRRRVSRLEALGACVVGDGGVIVPEAFLASPSYLDSVRTSHLRLRRFYEDLKAAGLLEPLPASAYPLAEEVPIRAAARLLADWILRSAEHLMRQAGDMVSTVVLLGVLVTTQEQAMQRAARVGNGRARPVGLLSQRLQIPQETVRRHLAELVDRDLCRRRGDAFVVSEDMLQQSAWQAFFRDNAVNVQRLFAGLAERGVVAAWDRAPPLPAAARAVG
jgi:hypothetical protein